LVDIRLWPTFELNGPGIARDAQGGVLQTHLDHSGRRWGIHHQTGPKAWLPPAGFTDGNAAERHAENPGTLQVQSPRQDAVRISLIQAAS
jgi:hypothetical protein